MIPKKRAIFMSPNGENIDINDIKKFKKEIIDDFSNYWMQGSGDGFIKFYDENNYNFATLMIGPNIQSGMYLHYIDELKKEDLLSLYNLNELNEVLETAEEIYASKGLFLPLDIAWEAIQYFIETGLPSPIVNWVTPEIIPEDGNW